MSNTNAVPDAWEDNWETSADQSPQIPTEPAPEQKKISSKVTKAQRRAQTLEFNRQLWAEAEGPKETNYFLETRLNATAPLRSEFKPPPILLSRKGPNNKAKKGLIDGVTGLAIDDESSDEDETSKKTLTAEERKVQAAKDREEKQRKYEERRQELFGSASNTTTTSSNSRTTNGTSGSSTPRTTTPTPPGSRSATPNRGRGRGGKRGAAAGTVLAKDTHQRREKELYDPGYTPKPDSLYLQRREKGPAEAEGAEGQPIRAPRGPDGSGRGGFGFSTRGAKTVAPAPAVETIQ